MGCGAFHQTPFVKRSLSSETEQPAPIQRLAGGILIAGKTFAELQALSRNELISLYDQRSEHVDLSLNLIKEEIWRRDAEASSQRMENFTRRMWWLTGVITILTVVNLGFVVYSVVT